jgi:hypothetical protein
MGASARALGVAELRAAIFQYLDQHTLTSAIRVSHGWWYTGRRLIWCDICSVALRYVEPHRRSEYGPLIRRLALQTRVAVKRDAANWAFPQLRILALHPSVAADPYLFAVTLACCGPLLGDISIIWSVPAVQANAGGVNAAVLGSSVAAAVAAAEAAVDAHMGVTSFVMNHDVLRRLAMLPNLRALHNRSSTVIGWVLEHTRMTLPTPFANLYHIDTMVRVADAPALIKLLSASGNVTELALCINAAGAHRATRNAMLYALADRLPQLRKLELRYSPGVLPAHAPAAEPHMPPPGSADALWLQAMHEFYSDDGGTGAAHETEAQRQAADDFAALRRLHALASLELRGAYVRMPAAAWRLMLAGMPRLTRLVVGRTCVLPPAALVIAGECCRELRELTLYMWRDLRRVLPGPPAPLSIMASAMRAILEHSTSSATSADGAGSVGDPADDADGGNAGGGYSGYGDVGGSYGGYGGGGGGCASVSLASSSTATATSASVLFPRLQWLGLLPLELEPPSPEQQAA